MFLKENNERSCHKNWEKIKLQQKFTVFSITNDKMT